LYNTVFNDDMNCVGAITLTEPHKSPEFFLNIYSLATHIRLLEPCIFLSFLFPNIWT